MAEQPIGIVAIPTETTGEKLRKAVHDEVDLMLRGATEWVLAHREEADFWRGWQFILTLLSLASGVAALVLTAKGDVPQALAAFVGTGVTAFAGMAGAERREAEHEHSCVDNMLLADALRAFLTVDVPTREAEWLRSRLDDLLRQRDAVVSRSPLRAAHRTQHHLAPPWGTLPEDCEATPLRHGLKLYFGVRPRYLKRLTKGLPSGGH